MDSAQVSHDIAQALASLNMPTTAPAAPGQSTQQPQGQEQMDDYQCGSILGMQSVYAEGASTDRLAVVAATDLLIKIVQNIVAKPEEERIRRVSKATKAFTKIASVPMAEDIFWFAGFTEGTEEDGTKVFRLSRKCEGDTKNRLDVALTELQLFRSNLEQQFPFVALLGQTLCSVAQDGSSLQNITTFPSLLGSYVGIYFSASWCPPCKQFTPILADCYTAIRAAGKAFQIVFVSCDRDEVSFNEYLGHQFSVGGSWLALPWTTVADKKDGLSARFGVSGIPYFVLLSPEGQIVLPGDKGRDVIIDDPTGMMFPWTDLDTKS